MATVIFLLWIEIGGTVGNVIGEYKLDVSGVEAHVSSCYPI